MNIAVPPLELFWLKQFFSGRNFITWQDIESGEGKAKYLDQIIPWLRNLSTNKICRPIVLPFFGKDGPIAWYAMASDARQFSQLRDEITAFIGPSFSDFNEEWSDLSFDNVSEMALKERFGNCVIRFSARCPGDREEIERILALYRALLIRRPEMPDRTLQPFGKVRGDFDRALLAGNSTHAQNLLEEMCSSGRVNAEQKKCLEVRLLVGLGRQEELARNYSLIASLMDLSLPPQTIVDIIEALYQTYIRPIEDNSDTSIIKGSFKQNIALSFGPLFRERKGILLPKVLRSFLLFEAVQDEPNITRCEAILSAYPDDAEGRHLAQIWFSSFTSQKTGKSSVVRLERVRQAIFDEDYMVAVDLCYEELSNPWVYIALLRCAVELRNSDVTSRVLDTLADAELNGAVQLTAKDKARLEQLRGCSGVLDPPTVDSNWVVWAKWVSSGTYHVSPLAALEKAILRWNIDEYINDAKQCDELAQIIGNSSGKQEEVFRSSFPHLVEFFVERPAQPARNFASLYAMLIKVTAWSGTASADELEIATLLTQALFTIGPTLEIYCECLDDLGEIIRANNSIIHLDWALNTAEILAIYPTQNAELRLRLFMLVVDIARNGSHRMTTTQRNVLSLLAKDYNCINLLDFIPAVDLDDRIEDRNNEFNGIIGIYTLMDGAGMRAKHLLENLLPKARIELNGDSVATDQLTSLARNADMFVFAWKSSKHQAFYCIKEARRGRNIIMPSGKGTASIVKSVLYSIASN
jgi:hypothetical protein